MCCDGAILTGYNWKNKKLDPPFMTALKTKEMLPLVLT